VILKVMRPECNRFTKIDTKYSEQECEVCGETFYDDTDYDQPRKRIRNWAEEQFGGRRQ
jgi:hypothetical protein